MRKHTRSALLLSLAAALIAMLGLLPGTSHADTAWYVWNPAYVGDSSRPYDDIVGTKLRYDFNAGDCTMAFDSYLEVDHTTHNLIWHAKMKTSHTNNGDIWWATFRFYLDGYGTLYTTPEIKSPTMYEAGHWYEWTLYVPIPPLSLTLHGTSQVEWKAKC